MRHPDVGLPWSFVVGLYDASGSQSVFRDPRSVPRWSISVMATLKFTDFLIKE